MPDTKVSAASATSGLLAGKAALITGSTSGIGLGIARALAQAGCNVALNARSANAESDKLTKDLAAETGVKVIYAAADMSKRDQIKASVALTEKEFGSLDILVNNAGIQHVEPIETFPDDDWEMVLSTNLSAAFYTTKAALPGMKARKWGRIINISSAHGLIASPFKSAYVAAKHGMIGLTKTTALETAQDGITCNAICPGYVWTPLVQKQIPEQAKAHHMTEEEVIKQVLLKEQPNRKFATVEQMGALAVFLSSESGATMTGTSLPVDGGWTAH